MSSISSSLTAMQLQVAVAKKQLDSAEMQGQSAVALIESSAPPEVKAAPVNTAPGVGTNLNVVA
jgi:hypothetical protein